MSRNYSFYIEDILNASLKVQRYTKGLTKETWKQSDLEREATLYNLEIIGEAISHIPADVRARYPEVDWRRIRESRIS